MLCHNSLTGAISLCVAGPPAAEFAGRADVAELESVGRDWISSSGVHRIRLTHLSRAETVALAREIAAPRELDAFWVEKIVRVSGGLPALVHAYVIDAVRHDRLSNLPDLLDIEARELPPAEAVEQIGARLARHSARKLSALVVLAQLGGLPLDRAREVARRGDLMALADAELLEIRDEDETVHVSPAVADVASDLLDEDAEETALARAADALMRFAPDGARSGVEALFLARTWLRLDVDDPMSRYDPEEVRAVLLTAARQYTRAGKARQALDILGVFTGVEDDARALIERARAIVVRHDHELVSELLARAERIVADVPTARLLLNRYRCLHLWHHGDPAAFAEAAARAVSWLPGSAAWARELAKPPESLIPAPVLRMLELLGCDTDGAELEAVLGTVAAGALTLGRQGVYEIAGAKLFEALVARHRGDAPRAVRAIDTLARLDLPEALRELLDAERASAAADDGDPAAGRRHVSAVLGAVRRAAADLAAAGAELDDDGRVAPIERNVPAVQQPAPAAAAAGAARAGADTGPDDAASARGAVVIEMRSRLHGPRAAAVLPAGLLSEREVLVAQLAAAGQTNTQIAHELFLSVRTVESHLHHARVKLGVTGRDGLADYFPEADDADAPAGASASKSLA